MHKLFQVKFHWLQYPFHDPTQKVSHFQNLFPVGDTMPFCEAIFRIFSNRHNADYLEFREFLNAMNVTTLRSEEEKFKVPQRVSISDRILNKL